MAITLINHAEAKSANGSSAATSGVDMTGANLLVIGMSMFAAGTPTDSEGNTYTGLTARTNAGTGIARLFYKLNPTVGASHTFSFNQGSSFPCLFAMGFAFDGEPTLGAESGAIASAATIQPGSITDQLLVTCMNSNGASPTLDSGFTPYFGFSNAGGTSGSGGMGYKIHSTPTAANPTWGVGAGIPCSAAMVGFSEVITGGITNHITAALAGGMQQFAGGFQRSK